jgi:hypothetical protein
VLRQGHFSGNIQKQNYHSKISFQATKNEIYKYVTDENGKRGIHLDSFVNMLKSISNERENTEI